jgi:regulator of replication initiation timing
MKKIKKVAVNEVALYNAIAVTEHDAITAQSDNAFSEIEHQKNIKTNLLSEIDVLKSTLKVAEKNMVTLAVENESLLDRLQNSIDTKEYKKNVLYTSLRFNDKIVEHHYNVKEFYVDSKNCHDQKYNRMYSLLEKDIMNVDVYFEADYATYQHNLYNSQIKKHNKLQLRFEDIIQE